MQRRRQGREGRWWLSGARRRVDANREMKTGDGRVVNHGRDSPWRKKVEKIMPARVAPLGLAQTLDPARRDGWGIWVVYSLHGRLAGFQLR
jgi:hypothetical protein